MEKNYVVYQHVTPDKMYYFGATQNVERRWSNNGAEYKRTSLQPYIEKYGWENIQHIVLFRDQTKEDALWIENFLIETAQEDGVCINKQRSGLITKKEGYKQRHYQQNRDRILEQKQDYYQKNRDEILEQKQEYYKHNKDKRKKYLEENRDRILEQRQEYYKHNKDKRKKYLEENRDRILEQKQDYYQKNRDRILEQRQDYYQKNRDEILEQRRQRYQRKKEEKQFKEF